MIWNISNILSIGRIILAFPLGLAIYSGDKTMVIILGAYGIISDYLDGFFARKYGQISDTGKILDPIGDKIMVTAAVIALLIIGKIPVWFVVIVAGRDILILLGGLYYKSKTGKVIPSNLFGKLTVNVISLALVLIIFDINYSYDYGLSIASCFAVISFLIYLNRMLTKLKENKELSYER